MAKTKSNTKVNTIGETKVSTAVVSVDPIVVDPRVMMGQNRHMSNRPIATRSVPIRQERSARSIGKMLRSCEVDGVSLNNTTLLQRQYDDSRGYVDPASDIHTDKHLLMDALMRKRMTTGTDGATSKVPESLAPTQNAE